MQLKYIGPKPVLGVVLLPEGWGSFDHDEPNEALAAEKVASGNYEYVKPPKPAKAVEEAKAEEAEEGD